MMNLYLIKRTDEVGYDDYDSAVVVAKDESEARHMHPADINRKYEDWPWL